MSTIFAYIFALKFYVNLTHFKNLLGHNCMPPTVSSRIQFFYILFEFIIFNTNAALEKILYTTDRIKSDFWLIPDMRFTDILTELSNSQALPCQCAKYGTGYTNALFNNTPAYQVFLQIVYQQTRFLRKKYTNQEWSHSIWYRLAKISQ